jgi:hypothetical protein
MEPEFQIEQPLPFPIRPWVINGVSVPEFIIPEEKKEEVLGVLYPFSPVPSLDEQMYDLHADKIFTVRDYRVTCEHGMNYLVSPYYAEAGGTVIDWVPLAIVEQWENEEEEEWSEEEGWDEAEWTEEPWEDEELVV